MALSTTKQKNNKKCFTCCIWIGWKYARAYEHTVPPHSEEDGEVERILGCHVVD